MIGALIAGLFGLCVGSAVNALVWRLSVGRSFVKGRSHCIHCDVVLAPYDLIPLVSFVILRGKCRACQRPIPFRYPAVELAVALFFAAVYWVVFVYTGNEFSADTALWFNAVRLWCAVSVLAVIFVYDAWKQMILDKVTIPAIIFFAVYNCIAGPLLIPSYSSAFSWESILLSAILGGGFFLLQYLVSRGAWVGGGDIRMGVLMGVILGFPHVLGALFLAYGLGAVVGLAILLINRNRESHEIAFGTFLSVATFIVLLFYNQFHVFFQEYWTF